MGCFLRWSCKNQKLISNFQANRKENTNYPKNCGFGGETASATEDQNRQVDKLGPRQVTIFVSHSSSMPNFASR